MAKRRSTSETKSKAADQQTAPGGRRRETESPSGGNGHMEAEMKPAAEGKREEHVLSGPEFNARVARKAFELFERRGGDTGKDVEDWLEAERQVKEEMLGGNEAGD